MNVICPKCKTENHLPDLLNRNTTYRCNACQTKFDRISRTNFGKVALVMLIVWWLVPVLVWAAPPIVHSAKENSFQYLIGGLFGWSPLYLLPPLLLATTFLLWEGFQHRKFTGVGPKGFRAFIFTSVLGFSGFAAGIGLFIRYVVAATN